MKFALVALFAIVAVASANQQKAGQSAAAAIAAAEQVKLAKSSDYDTYGSSYQSDYSRPGKLHHKCTCICPAPYRKTYVQQTYSQPQPSYVDSRSNEVDSDKHQLAALLQAMGAGSSQQKAASMHH